jgi:superfamily II DNA/RNA helicase
MRRAGFARPSRTQELGVPVVLGGGDVVLAAETGSGKTLAYLAPLADQLLAAASELPQETRE